MADSLTLCGTEVLWIDGCVENPIPQPVTVPVISSTSVVRVCNQGEADRKETKRTTENAHTRLFLFTKNRITVRPAIKRVAMMGIMMTR